MNAVIESTGLSKRYKDKMALNRCDFRVETGRIVGLIGPNGAGKTTALKAILGLTSYEGRLSVLGLDPFTQRHQLMQDVCFIADVAILPRWIRVREAIAYVEGVHPRFDRAKCERFLAATQIKPHSRVRELSKGMIAQLHLALVMAIDARLLILDEPTLGLDILYRRRFYEQLLNDYFDETRTILVTTHQVEEIEHILTDLLFIKDGGIALAASMDEVAERYCQVLVGADRIEAARALQPISERKMLGKSVFLYDRLPRERAQQLGEVHQVGVADLFVAVMGGGVA
ncbi:MAG: ABC transporter ATP-binding protein [Lysobacterales bacterium]